MTSPKAGDEPAFPHCSEAICGSGLTKREIFAKAAMQGLLANDGFHCVPEEVSEEAVRYADALLAALSKGEGK